MAADVRATSAHHGHILVLPGIDGWSLFNRGIIPGLRAGGVPCGIEFYDWTRGFPHMLGNLTDPELHSEQAQLLAERISADSKPHRRRTALVDRAFGWCRHDTSDSRSPHRDSDRYRSHPAGTRDFARV